MRILYTFLLSLIFLIYPLIGYAFDISRNTSCLFIVKDDGDAGGYVLRLVRSASVIDYSPFTPIWYKTSVSYTEGGKNHISTGLPERGTSGYVFKLSSGGGDINITAIDIPVFPEVREEYRICNPSDLLQEGIWESVDGVTGNLFRAAVDDSGFITVSVFGVSGGLLVTFRMDPFSLDSPVDISSRKFARKVKVVRDDTERVVALDLSGIPQSKLKNGYYWFAGQGELADFVYEYLRSDAVSYVNFILNSMILRRMTKGRWPRLPVIPLAGGDSLRQLDRSTADKFSYRSKLNWKEEHGGNSYICTLATFTKLVEDRDCRLIDDEEKCPDYSEMFMLHGLLKTYFSSVVINNKWDLASSFFNAMEIYSKYGVCSEKLYPYDRKIVESNFSSETVFSKMVRKRFKGILKFDGDFPAECSNYGTEYLSLRKELSNDFVISGVLHEEGGTRHFDVSSQRKELFYLLITMLNRGYFVGVMGKRGHAALALPWLPPHSLNDENIPSSSEKGITLWSSAIESKYRIMTVPFKNMKREIDQIVFENSFSHLDREK